MTELDRLAEAELLLEAKRGLARSNVCGPTGWKRCPLPGTNKTFLHNTIKNVISSNKLKEQKQENKLGKIKQDMRIECSSTHPKRKLKNEIDIKYRSFRKQTSIKWSNKDSKKTKDKCSKPRETVKK